MSAISTILTSTTTFDFSEMANDQNGYDHSKIHPMNAKIVFISKDGQKEELSVSQLAMITALINAAPYGVGRSINKLRQSLNDVGMYDEVLSICKRF